MLFHILYHQQVLPTLPSFVGTISYSLHQIQLNLLFFFFFWIFNMFNNFSSGEALYS